MYIDAPPNQSLYLATHLTDSDSVKNDFYRPEQVNQKFDALLNHLTQLQRQSVERRDRDTAVREMSSNQLRQWAADLIGAGCNSVDLLRHQIEVEQGWTWEEDDFLIQKIASQPEGDRIPWAQLAANYQTALGKKKRTPLQLEARGKYLMKQLHPNRGFSKDSGLYI